MTTDPPVDPFEGVVLPVVAVSRRRKLVAVCLVVALAALSVCAVIGMAYAVSNANSSQDQAEQLKIVNDCQARALADSDRALKRGVAALLDYVNALSKSDRAAILAAQQAYAERVDALNRSAESNVDTVAACGE